MICSSNLVEYDWSILENVVYVQDFPKTRNKACVFQTELKNLLTYLDIPEALISTLDSYDFSRAKGHLVFSKPGIYKNDSDQYSEFGLLGLKRAVSRISIDSPSNANLECQYLVCICDLISQTSSLGSLKTAWIRDFLECANGHGLADVPSSINERGLKVVFPTHEYVKQSMLGPNAAGLFI